MNYNFEIIEKSNPKWNEILKKSTIYDFHHSAYYHEIDTEFSTIMLYFEGGESFIALPIVVRPIENTPYFDITSVYGYAGPIFRFDDDLTKLDLIEYFQHRFQQYCKEQNIVSVFSRLHPLIDQNQILEGLGEIVDLNKTVSIDLTIDADSQRKNYRKSLKSELNQLRKKEISIDEATTNEEIDAFIDIYYETMDRVNATKNYYFSKEYFYNFLNTDAFGAKLLVAKKDEKVIAGAIFTFADKIMQYHLAGTTEEFIRETPMKLILDEARLLGNKTSAQSLHLGGGVGGSDDDSLFKFKSGFSKDFKQFRIWKYIANTDIYTQLVQSKNINTNSNFFPLYRQV